MNTHHAGGAEHEVGHRRGVGLGRSGHRLLLTVPVGLRPHLVCEGPWPELHRDKLELRLDKADQYKLKILDFQYISKDKAQFLVTSYKVGDHQLKAVQVVDDVSSVLLGDLRFTVKSVKNPNEPESEPFGPMGPILLSMPWWYWMIWLALFVGAGILVWIKIRRRMQRQKLLEEFRTHGSSLSPLHQFSQQMRKLQKEFSFFYSS
jgi:hypothetical protein